MTEYKIRELVKEFSDIVESIKSIEFTEEERVSKIKAKLRLVDATVLWIREIEVYGSIVAYSYYWLRPGGSTIVGWDNAPHHKEVQTFPHHKHIGKNIEPSEQRDVRKVMKFIRDFLG
jgi:hypothetical protein